MSIEGNSKTENSEEKSFILLLSEYETLKKRLFEIDAEVVERGDEEEMLAWGQWGGGRIVKAEYMKEVEQAIENYKKGIDKKISLSIMQSYIKSIKSLMPECENFSKK